ncbi:MAG: phosphatase PAP2 family protein [Casimicrobium sp.]
MTQRSFASLSAFARARLSLDARLGLHLTLGAVVFMLCAFVFGHIAEDVLTMDKITILDIRVSRWFHAHTIPWLTRLMMLISDIHSTFGIVALSSLLAIYWIRIKAWDWLLALILTVPFGMLLNLLLKAIFQRTRPGFDVPLLTPDGFSFPSGHTAAATLLYGLLAVWLICTTSAWPKRVLIAMLASMCVGLVGLSRIYLGVHYLSDVLAAVAASCGWLAFSLMVVSVWRTRRSSGQHMAGTSNKGHDGCKSQIGLK